MQIMVRDNNVDQALRALKKKLQREGVYREMKLRRHYEKPSESAPAKRPPPCAAPARWSASGWSATGASNPVVRWACRSGSRLKHPFQSAIRARHQTRALLSSRIRD